MTQEVREFPVTVPAGTAAGNPLVTDISFPDRVVVAVSWRVPPGPSGLMGWALTSAGARVIPIQPGAWIVADNQADTWPLDGYLDSGNWQVTAYNEGTYDHTVYLTFQLDLPGAAISPVASPAGLGAGLTGVTGMVTAAASLPLSLPPVTTPGPAAGTATTPAGACRAGQLPAAPAGQRGGGRTLGGRHGG